MDNRAEVRDFLTSRRARIRPEDVGLPAGTNRGVKGLSFTIYTAELGSASAERIQLLASWAASEYTLPSTDPDRTLESRSETTW